MSADPASASIFRWQAPPALSAGGIVRVVLLACVSAILSSGAVAQTQTGTLVGLVCDREGQAVSGAEIELRADTSHAVTHTLTDSSGKFVLVGLPPGPYVLKLQRSGQQEPYAAELYIRMARTLDVYLVLPRDGSSGKAITDRLVDRDVLAGRHFGEVAMRELPTTRRIYSFLENQDTSNVTYKIDTAGLETGARTLFGVRGLSWTQNEYSLNGFDVTDPYLPGALPADPDFAALAGVITIAGAKPASFSGTGSNVILTTPEARSSLHAAVRGFFSQRALQSDNMTERLVQLGFPGPERLRHLVDASGQTSGELPLGKTKLPFFISLSSQSLSKTLGGFPAPIDAHALHGLAEVTLFRRSSKQLNLLYAGQHMFNSAADADPRISPDAARRSNDNFHQFQARWSSAPTANSELELGFGVAHAIVSSGAQPGTATPSTIDLPQLTITGAAPFSVAGTRTRYQAYGQFQIVHDGSLGSHSLVLGSTIAQSRIANRWSVTGAFEQILVDGVGAEVIRWNAPTQARQHMTEFGLFAQDAWRPTHWLAIPFGLRLEHSAGQSHAAGNRISWTTIEPRVGFVTRLPVVGATLRGGFARYGDLLSGRDFDFGNEAALGGQVFQWHDANSDRMVQPFEIGPLLRVFGGPYSSVDKNLRRPLTDEISAEVTKEIGKHFIAGVRFFRRDDRRLLAIVNSGVPFSSYAPTVVIDPGEDGITGTFDDRSLTVFNRLPQALGKDLFVLSNPPGYRGSDKGMEIEMSRRFSRHWQGSLNFTAMHAAYPTNPGNDVFQNDPGFIITDQSVSAASNADPNTLLFRNGRTFFDRGFTGKLNVYYEAPYGLHVGIIARYFDGLVFGRMLFIDGFNQGPFFVRATARGDQGAFRTNLSSTLDLRVARAFGIKRSKLSFDLDVFNLLNLSRDTRENDLTGPDFNKRIPLAIQVPRTIRIGLGWEFSRGH
jgi:carboxypeptidase family protein